MRELELLAPARDVSIAREAILHGADAVYIGAPSHGARSKATNTIEDIQSLVAFAKPFGVKVYVTVNTIVYEAELREVDQMIRKLYRIGVDALIVQDMGILKMDIPPIALHASTQCDTRTPEDAKMLEDAGFSQIVVARELSLKELKRVCSSVRVPIEAFVHGALCVSYSGDCQASFVNNGRSANRGECAQMCRLPYDLLDGDGKTIGRGKHYLSLKDMSRIDSLAEMIEAGVDSFKIEGRLKDAAYVKNVTAAYRDAIDKIIANNPGLYRRSSRGTSKREFTPMLSRSFNRGFTDYFLRESQPRGIATFDSPKALGREVGSVRSMKGKLLTVNMLEGVNLNNGDGLSFITPQGESGGFRINRSEGTRLHLLEDVNLPKNTRLFLSYDRKWESSMSKPTAKRSIAVDMTLRRVGVSRIALDGTIEGVGMISVTEECEIALSEKPDNGYRRTTLGKLGNTVFELRGFEDRLGEQFVPASVLTSLRRNLVQTMLHTLSAIKQYDYRRKPVAVRMDGLKVTRHANVSNSLARRFYTDAGASEIDSAIEVSEEKPKGEIQVMETRYCLRRELGCCLKSSEGNKLKGPLRLMGSNFIYRLDFDCGKCRMRVIKEP